MLLQGLGLMVAPPPPPVADQARRVQ
jgi:hypothetical protein